MRNPSGVGLLLLCGGSGQRMAGSVPDKTLEPLGDDPVFAWSLRAFAGTDLIGEAVLVVRESAQETAMRQWLEAHPLPFPIRFTQGGGTRQASVHLGLESLSAAVDTVAIHDAARPLLRPEQIRQVIEAANSHGAASLAHRITDTITRTREGATAGAYLLETLPRERLWAMETPQVFQLKQLLEVRKQADWSDPAFTDDTAAFAYLGLPVALVENPHPNPKLTHPGDWIFVRTLMAAGAP